MSLNSRLENNEGEEKFEEEKFEFKIWGLGVVMGRGWRSTCLAEGRDAVEGEGCGEEAGL